MAKRTSMDDYQKVATVDDLDQVVKDKRKTKRASKQKAKQRNRRYGRRMMEQLRSRGVDDELA